jgi:NitT/TauT family transport system permease protein
MSLAFREELPQKSFILIAGSVFLLLFVVWCVLSYGKWVSEVFLPTPTAVLQAFIELARDQVLLQDVWISNFRILVGFLLAAILSIPLGMLVGNLKIFEAALEPLVGFIRYMPVPAFIPLIMLYVGIGEEAKILVIFIGVVVQMVIMVADVTKQVSADLLKAALSLGAKPDEIFTKIIWKASLPGIFDVLRVNLGWAWTYLVVAELVAANEGLGFRILKAQRFLKTDIIFLYIFLIGVLGVVFDVLFKTLHKRFFPWAQERLRG